MSPWADARELREDLVAVLERFLQSPDGATAAALAHGLEGPAVLELTLHDPELVLHVDIAARRVTEGPAAEAAARLEIQAPDLHDLLLDRLGPVEISRLVEEARAHLDGSPPALTTSLMLAARLQPHYADCLRERGRTGLLNAPERGTGEIWASATPPPPVFGVRRPWQRPKGAGAAAG